MESKFKNLIYESSKDALKEMITNDINKRNSKIETMINKLSLKQEITNAIKEMINNKE